MAITRQELDSRARERAVSERLHTFKIAGQATYMVRSRETEPGAMHRVDVTADGTVARCSCKGWDYRRSCVHSAAVPRRLEREHKVGRPAGVTNVTEPTPIVSASRRSQLYPEA
jgi:hypothetical protein